MQLVMQDFVFRNELSQPLKGPYLISEGGSQSALERQDEGVGDFLYNSIYTFFFPFVLLPLHLLYHCSLTSCLSSSTCIFLRFIYPFLYRRYRIIIILYALYTLRFIYFSRLSLMSLTAAFWRSLEASLKSS